MNRRTQRHSRRNALAAGTVLLTAAFVVLGTGCSDESVTPDCVNCENWEQITPGLARFPEPHPVDAEIVAYSTVDKSPGAPDANKDADEDLWLNWPDPTETTGFRSFQVTGDLAAGSALTVGDNLGDNFSPRWSPSGTQLAFLHTTQTGTFEIWRMPVTLTGGLPVLGAPELVVTDARDPSWQSETQIFFTRDDKIFRIEIPAGSGPPVGAPVQMTFNPPSYASSDDFVDRHPDFAADGEGVFDTQDRRNVAQLLVEAFEVDDTVVPPDTFPTEAHISFFPPGASVPAYPIFEGSDTLTTPSVLNSLPVDDGGDFIIGVRRDFRFLADSLAETYCDTTLTKTVELNPGDVDTVSFYFRISRGSLRLTSGLSGTSVFWRRADARVTISDFPGTPLLNDLGEALRYDCLLSYAIGQTGAIREDSLETFLVTGAKLSKTDSVLVTIPPGQQVDVHLFPTGAIHGTMAFADQDTTFPRVRITALDTGTDDPFALTFSDTTGNYVVPRLPVGTYDLQYELAGYQTGRVNGISVVPPDTTEVAVVTLVPEPGPAARATVLEPAPSWVDEPVRTSNRVTTYCRAATSIDRPASLGSLFRDSHFASTLWRIDASDLDRPAFTQIFGSEGIIQNPAVTADLGGGVRYVAYVSDESGSWELYVQRLENWIARGSPTRVATPGTFDNLSCNRSTFHPRWSHGGSGLSLVVAMSDCPDNGFEGLGTDDDPWSLGELRIWQVDLGNP